MRKPILLQTDFEDLSWLSFSSTGDSNHLNFHGWNLSQREIHRKCSILSRYFTCTYSLSCRKKFCLLIVNRSIAAAASHHRKSCCTNFVEPEVSAMKTMWNDEDLYSDDDNEEKLAIWLLFTCYVHRISAFCDWCTRRAVAQSALQISLWDFGGCGMAILSTVYVKNSLCRSHQVQSCWLRETWRCRTIKVFGSQVF